MLSFLQIRNFAIAESLDLEFSRGFTAITGETGTGKSILVDALGLLIGNRADTAMIRSGRNKAELSAEFDLADDSPALAWLRSAELDQGNSCLLRRLVSERGRSRAWVNGTAVTLQQLAELGELLVEINGQNEHIRLVRSGEQFRLLDAAGSHDDELARVADAFDTWSRLDQERQSLQGESRLGADELDLLQHQVQELEQNLLTTQAFAALEAEHRRLAHGSDIKSVLEFAITALDSEESGITQGIHAALHQLQSHATLDSDIAEAAQLLNEASINCDEARNSLQSALSRLDLSPERYAELEQQLSIQHELARKHRVQPQQLEDVLNGLRERSERAGNLDLRLQKIEGELDEAISQYRKAARALNQARVRRAGELSTAVTALMQQLGMVGGRFEIEVAYRPEVSPSRRGCDRLELLVSANPGVPTGPLKKVASGGELSRISLAIKVACQAESPAETQIFDEIDAGIGGDTANAVGALLLSLSRGGQALCVTHLAQVAVCADQQYCVQKRASEQLTKVTTSLLGEAERIDEIARMLGGRLSEQSRAHASELLATAATRH